MTFCKWNYVHLNIEVPKKEKNLYKKLYSLTCCNFNITVGQLKYGHKHCEVLLGEFECGQAWLC